MEWQRPKQPDIGGLMPGPCSLRPAADTVNIAYHIAKSQDSVVLGEVVSRHALAVRDTAVVRVMKEQPVMRMGATVLADSLYECWIVPFMNQHEIGFVERLGEIQRSEIV